ncbi:MAG: hypothetical protein ACRCYP_03770 [Alphaproteobacteria bacterium]
MSDLKILFQKLKITPRRLRRMGYFERRDVLQRAIQECCAEGIYLEVSSWESVQDFTHAFMVNKRLSSGTTVQAFCSVNDWLFQNKPELAIKGAIGQINTVFWRQQPLSVVGGVECSKV